MPTTHTNTSVGICWWKVQFSPPMFDCQHCRAIIHTVLRLVFLSSPRATLALSRQSVLRWDFGRIWATVGHQSHCGISSKLPIRHLQPVKVSLLLIPDCKSSPHGPWCTGKRFILIHFLPCCAAVWEDFAVVLLFSGNSWEESSLWQRGKLQCAVCNGEAQRIQLSNSSLLCTSPHRLTRPCY